MPKNRSKIDHETALEYGVMLGKTLKVNHTPVRSAFFYRDGRGDQPPPAARLLTNRSHNGLHLKLALLYLWGGTSGNPDRETGEIHTIRRFHDSFIANLFGFPDPDGNGKRRVANARKRLAEMGLIRLDERKGHSPQIRLLNEGGTGDPYIPPGSEEGGGKYQKLPRGFWTGGWHSALSGPAVVALLVLAHMKSTTNDPEIWVNPTFREDHFGFSEDTWYAGANELCRVGLADRLSKPVREPWKDESRRRRYKYLFDLGRLATATPPTVPDPYQIIDEDAEARAKSL